MDVISVLIKLKIDAMQNVEDWKNELNNRKDEAIVTLKNERVSIESWFHFNIEGSDYLMVYMRSDDMQYAQHAFKESQSDIDQYHQAFKKNWEKGIKGTLLVDLENLE